MKQYISLEHATTFGIFYFFLNAGCGPLVEGLDLWTEKLLKKHDHQKQN